VTEAHVKECGVGNPSFDHGEFTADITEWIMSAVNLSPPHFEAQFQLQAHYLHNQIMGVAFDHAPDRPEQIDAILNGLDRYNPETTEIFSKYVMEQCENRTYDCYANLALLKL
jgi:hypothetical protein